MVTYQLALTSISDFFLLSKVATIQQIDGITHKLKPRLFHKSIYYRVQYIKYNMSLKKPKKTE